MDVRMEPSWKAALAGEFGKPYFTDLVRAVRHEYASGPVYPSGGDIFAAFEQTPLSAVRVVIIGQDPYHGEGQANGLAFSVRPGVSLPPSLVNIFKEVHAETGAPMPVDGDLRRWSRQGVLLLNAALTVRAGQPRSHRGLGWEEFTDAAVRVLEATGRPLVYMLWGADAQRKGAGIDRGRSLVLRSPHPSPLSAHRGFFGNGHFNMANRWLAAHGETPVVW